MISGLLTSLIPSLSTLSFLMPWMLAGLLVLPVIWYLLRISPPSPERVIFPPARLIFDLPQTEETAAHTPLWLLLLRFLIAALIVIGLSQPVVNPVPPLPASGPVVLAFDDSWAAAPHWQSRRTTMLNLTAQAARQDRAVILLPTTRSENGALPRPQVLTAAAAAEQLRNWQPRPWAARADDFARAVDALPGVTAANIYWLESGIEDETWQEPLTTLRRMGRMTRIGRGDDQAVYAIRDVAAEKGAVAVQVARDLTTSAASVSVRALAEDGRPITQQMATFAAGAAVSTARFVIPLEARNKVRRFQILGQTGAAATWLAGNGLKQYRVGLAAARRTDDSQPLLAEAYYLSRTLVPFAEIIRDDLKVLLERPLSVILLPDNWALLDDQKAALQKWVEAGGVLVRFAGPRLAENRDEMVPVPLRRGGRALQGAMSWTRPARLAPFPDSSPFAGLPISDDVRVRRQVLAEPTLDLSDRTWARLQDGTPLVTGRQMERGWLVLFHTSANAEWSDLAISGLFVEMLNRLTGLADRVEAVEGNADLPPVRVLDGLGTLVAPNPNVRALPGRGGDETAPGPHHPPGLYGTASGARAFNLGPAVSPEPSGILLDAVPRVALAENETVNLSAWLLVAALVLFLLDMTIAALLYGGNRGRDLMGAMRNAVSTGSGNRTMMTLPVLALVAVALFFAVGTGPGRAQSNMQDASEADMEILRAVMVTRLGYVKTGNRAQDRMSAAGMRGLSQALTRRTSVEPGTPTGLDLEKDTLLFYPMIYWPMVESQPRLSDAALAKVARYMATGGLLLVDTLDDGGADRLLSDGRPGAGTRRLRQLASRLKIGALTPVKKGHVLSRSFYLTDTFPGRYSGGRVWVEQRMGEANDGVSPIVIGGADWASAWAISNAGDHLAMVESGRRRQRELAYRFGINLVMYALTGNYKADQVHVPAILERLGQ